MYNSIIFKIIFVITCFLGMKTYGQNLDNHKWKSRILIVKTLSSNSKKHNNQLKEFKNSDKDFKERKLVLYIINQDKFSLTNYTDSTLNYSGKVTKSLAENILTESEDFEIILIGLDGRIKLKQNEILLKEDLFSLIDSMPMRKNEMKN